ncbi:hypothetical protein RchiOBHm_Chr6g0276471 [Rosa chinensis]|uniref:Uncharacterized protein n=1 Tax=Rosa chinensis TaxID=74649 RepID=A0A2P6PSA6_ROSCH|nr:hypothetical protein RchiOBHm_Chr6g0276471 [Rosa chinensis]
MAPRLRTMPFFPISDLFIRILMCLKRKAGDPKVILSKMNRDGSSPEDDAVFSNL